MTKDDVKTTADLIMAIESGGDQWAYRYEPAHHVRDDFATRMQEICNCSKASSIALCSASWGTYQIMGDELIAMGLTVSPLQFCSDKIMQKYYVNLYLKSNGIDIALSDLKGSDQKRRMFARIYNGPGNVDAYVARMESFL